MRPSPVTRKCKWKRRGKGDLSEHCRRDDIESWFYMLLDFTFARLPWKPYNNLDDIGQSKANSRGIGRPTLLQAR